MKQRLQATHFIEQHNGLLTGKSYFSTVEKTDMMDFLLRVTNKALFKTIAIWKIKFKNQQP